MAEIQNKRADVYVGTYYEGVIPGIVNEKSTDPGYNELVKMLDGKTPLFMYTTGSGKLFDITSMITRTSGANPTFYAVYATKPNATELVFEEHAIAPNNTRTIAKHYALPATPTADGEYTLKCNVSNGKPAFSWVTA